MVGAGRSREVLLTTSETSQQRRSTTDQHQRVDVEQALLGGSTYKGVAEQELSERERTTSMT